MENSKDFNEIAYKKAQKRVKEIRAFWWIIFGYLLIGGTIFYRNYDGNIMDISKEYSIWMVILWGVFLAIYAIYLFVPFFYNWEERKINKLMKNQNKN